MVSALMDIVDCVDEWDEKVEVGEYKEEYE